MSTMELLANRPQSGLTALSESNSYVRPIARRDFRRDDYSASPTAKRPPASPLGPIGFCIGTLLGGALQALLLPGLRATSKYLRRLHDERAAIDCGSGREWGRLEKIYNRTLDRLGDTRNTAGLWQRLVLVAEADCVLPYRVSEPHFLAIPSVREWLSNAYVRADLKLLASEKIFGTATDTDAARQRLADWYAHYTAEDSALAVARINAAISGLVAGVLSNLNRSEQLLIELMRYSNLSRRQTQTPMFCYDRERLVANNN
jgi:hypothetical protein